MRRNKVTDDHPGHIRMFDRSRAGRAGRRDGRRGVPSPSDPGTTPYIQEVHLRVRTAEYAESLELHREYARLDGELVAAARTVVAHRDKAEAGDQTERADDETAPVTAPGQHATPDGRSDRLPSPRTGEHSSPTGAVAEKPPAWVERERRARRLRSDVDSAKKRLTELASQWLHQLELHRSRVQLAENRYEELLLIYRSAVLARHPHAATLEESWELPAYQPGERWMTEDPAPPSRAAEPEVAELLVWALQEAHNDPFR